MYQGSNTLLSGSDGQQCMMKTTDVRRIGIKKQRLAVEGTFANEPGETILLDCVPLTTSEQQYDVWSKTTPKLSYKDIIKK